MNFLQINLYVKKLVFLVHAHNKTSEFLTNPTSMSKNLCFLVFYKILSLSIFHFAVYKYLNNISNFLYIDTVFETNKGFRDKVETCPSLVANVTILWWNVHYSQIIIIITFQRWIVQILSALLGESEKEDKRIYVFYFPCCPKLISFLWSSLKHKVGWYGQTR